MILVANRDEFFARPTRFAQRWDEAPGILAGKDLQAGGTWLGVSENGRMAAVTNYRDLPNIRSNARSRGELVTQFLSSDESVEVYLNRVHDSGLEYNGFNLIVWAGGQIGYTSNYSEDGPRLLRPGVYGLSNALLDTPWPKVTRGKNRLSSHMTNTVPTSADLFELVRDTDLASENELPDTGVGIELEKQLSAMFIRVPGYGTRSSTALVLRADGQLLFSERSYDEGGETVNDFQAMIESFSVDALPKPL